MIQSSPSAKHTINPDISPPILTPVSDPPFSISNSKLPIMIGMLIKNEYLALMLSQPIILDVAIVVPLLLIPGITAMPWEMPIIIACL